MKRVVFQRKERMMERWIKRECVQVTETNRKRGKSNWIQGGTILVTTGDAVWNECVLVVASMRARQEGCGGCTRQPMGGDQCRPAPT